MFVTINVSRCRFQIANCCCCCGCHCYRCRQRIIITKRIMSSSCVANNENIKSNSIQYWFRWLATHSTIQYIDSVCLSVVFVPFPSEGNLRRHRMPQWNEGRRKIVCLHNHTSLRRWPQNLRPMRACSTTRLSFGCEFGEIVILNCFLSLVRNIENRFFFLLECLVVVVVVDVADNDKRKWGKQKQICRFH